MGVKNLKLKPGAMEVKNQIIYIKANSKNIR